MNKNRFQIVMPTKCVLIERGKVDSIKQIVDYWGDASINEIHYQVMEWKAKKRIDRK